MAQDIKSSAQPPKPSMNGLTFDKPLEKMTGEELKTLLRQLAYPGRSKLTNKTLMVAKLNELKANTAVTTEVKVATPNNPTQSPNTNKILPFTKGSLIDQLVSMGIKDAPTSASISLMKDQVETVQHVMLPSQDLKAPAGFSNWVYNILKEVHPDTGTTAYASVIMQSLINFVINRYMDLYTDVATKGQSIITLTPLALPGQLAKHALSEVDRVVQGTSNDRRLQTVRMGRRYLLKTRAYVLEETQALHLATVLEYLVAELTELAGNEARDNKRQRITWWAIYKAIALDAELKQLFDPLMNEKKYRIPWVNEASRVSVELLGKDVSSIFMGYV